MNQEPISLLLIEDNQDDVIIFKEMIAESKGLRCTISHSTTIADAKIKLTTQIPDIVFIDLKLPDSTGFNSFEAIHALVPVPIILLTGLNDENIALEALRNGAQDYINKNDINQYNLQRIILYAIERKKSLEAIIESNNRFKSLFEVSNDAIFVLNTDLFVTQLNASAALLLGYTQQEIEMKRIDTFLDRQSQQELVVLFKMNSSTLKAARKDLLITCKDSTQRIVDCAFSAIRDSKGSVSMYVLSMRDITKKKISEFELKKRTDYVEHAHKQILAELSLTNQIQRCLYPQHIQEFDGLVYASELIQAREMSTDYYDVLQLNDSEIAFIIAEISGNDVASSFLVGMAKISFQAHFHIFSSLIEILNHVNSDMVPFLRKTRTISAFVCVINIHTGIVRYANAGKINNYLLKKATGSVERLMISTHSIGEAKENTFEEKSVKLENGDKLILSTNGVIQNKNRVNERYGVKRFVETIRRSGFDDVQAMLSKIIENQKEFSEGKNAEFDMSFIIYERTECLSLIPFQSVVDIDDLSIHPILINSNKMIVTATSKILYQLDINAYSDQLIRHYKKIIPMICTSFISDGFSQNGQLRMSATVTKSNFSIYFIIEKTKESDTLFFTSYSFTRILNHFNADYGVIELNEEGTRLCLSYEKINSHNITDGSVAIDIKNDGIYVTVPKTIESHITPEFLHQQILEKDIINADKDLIALALSMKSGEPQRITDSVVYFNSDKYKYFTFTIEPLCASIILTQAADTNTRLNRMDIVYLLNKNGITYGIDSQAIIDLVTFQHIGKTYHIAKGTDALAGTDACIKKHIPLQPLEQELFQVDGSLNATQLPLLTPVSENTLLMEKIPLIPAQSGMSIFGRIIDAPQPHDHILMSGENTFLSDDHLQIFSAVNGYAYLRNGHVAVVQLTYIQGNIDYKSGNIYSDYDVFITGGVQSGFEVSAKKNITIQKEAEAATLKSMSGSIFCLSNIVGKKRGSLSAGENIYAESITEASVECGKDLRIHSHIEMCSIKCNGNVYIGEENKGSLIGGVTVCNGSLCAAEIGDEKQTPTIIEIPVKHNDDIRRRIFLLRNKDKNTSEEVGTIKNMLKYKSKLFKLKSQKTKNDKIEIEALLEKYNDLRQRHIKIKNSLCKLEQTAIESATYGTILVQKTVYPNVLVRFGIVEKMISTKTGPVEIRLVEDKILVEKYQ